MFRLGHNLTLQDFYFNLNERFFKKHESSLEVQRAQGRFLNNPG